jgi:iron complex transport system substrate-binding protein
MLFIAFWASVCASVCSAAPGRAVTPSPAPLASRIVTLTPALGEIVADIAGNQGISRIVGVSDFTDQPPALKKAARIASATQINLEAVVALKPDLVVASADGNSPDQVAHLEELGLKVLVVKSVSLADIEDSIGLIGDAMGDPTSGQAALARFRAGEEQIRDHAKLRKLHPVVMMEISGDPLIVAGKGSFLNDAIELVGAKNVFDDLPTGYPRPSVEEAVRRDPDAIVIPSSENPQIHEEIAAWKSRFPKMKAVVANKVRMVRSDALLRPSPGILQGIIALEHAIYAR